MMSSGIWLSWGGSPCGLTAGYRIRSSPSRQLARLLGPGAVELAPGGHDIAFWKSHALAQLQFLAS